MKKIYLISAFFAANVLSAQNADFESISLPSAESYWNGSDYSGVSNGVGLFDATFTDGGMTFNSQYDTTWGASWGYWSQGWAFSNQTPDTTTGLPGAYSSYAGGANSGSNYAIGKNGSEIILGNNAGNILQLRVTNINYAAHSMMMGDAFAKQFGSIYDANGAIDSTNGEDWFLLTVVGYNTSGSAVDSVDFYLADYRFANNTQDYIVKNWTILDLSILGSVAKIKFKLSSSDVGSFGMNTPGFFAIDDVIQGFVGIEENNLQSKFYPNPATDIVTVETNSTNGTVEIIDIAGKKLQVKTYTSSLFQVDISTLPSGTYFVVLTSENQRKTTKLVKF